MKTLALILLSAVALFAGTPAENATALNMLTEDYEMMMALSGIVTGGLFGYRIFNI